MEINIYKILYENEKSCHDTNHIHCVIYCKIIVYAKLNECGKWCSIKYGGGVGVGRILHM